MFDNVNLIDSFEDHLNSSEDSQKDSDSSYEEKYEDKYIPPSLKEIDFRKFRYNNYHDKINKAKEELQTNKSGSMWLSVYYTFFGGNKLNSVNLSELELRLNFLSKREEITKNKKEAPKKEDEKVNINEFINKFNSIENDYNIFNDVIYNRNCSSEEESQSDSLEDNKNYDKRKPIYSLESIENKRKSTQRKVNKKSIQKLNLNEIMNTSKQNECLSLRDIKLESHSNKPDEKNEEKEKSLSIFDLYNFDNLDDLSVAYKDLYNRIKFKDEDLIGDDEDKDETSEKFKEVLQYCKEGSTCFEIILNEYKEKFKPKKKKLVLFDNEKQEKKIRNDILNFISSAELPNFHKQNLFNNFNFDLLEPQNRLLKLFNKVKSNIIDNLSSRYKVVINNKNKIKNDI